MSRLPGFIKEPLAVVASAVGKPEDLVGAAAGLLDAERRLEGLSRAVEAFREAARSLGILEEARNGQRLYDSWSKLSRFFLAPLLGGSSVLSGKAAEYVEVPPGYESIGTRWERMIPEVEAFVAEEKLLERAFAESHVSAHIGFKFRSRLVLLDRRAERVKVALDLVRRDLTAAARLALEQLAAGLVPRPRVGARPAPRLDDPGAAP